MIELSVSLASNGVVKVPGYEQLVRFGYTKNRGVYRLAVTASGEWAGLAIRCFWHVPDGKEPASSLVKDGSVAVPSSVTAQPGSGCVTFEGSDGTKTVTSADLRYRVSANSGTEDGTEPEPGTPAWQQLVDAVHTDATAAEQAKNDAQTAAGEAAGSLQELKDCIASGDFKGEKGDPGPIGPVGPQGEQGPQGPAVALDTTLTHEGEAADAKATGDAISAVKARQNILIGTETGNPLSVDDAFPAPLCGLTVYGKSTQDDTPTPDAPVPIVSAGDGGSVAVKVTGRNILDMRNSKKSYTNSGVTCTRNADYSFTRTGTAVDAIGNVWLAGGYRIKPNTDLYNVFCVLLKGVKYSIKDCVLFAISLTGDPIAAQGQDFVPVQDMYITGVRNEVFIKGKTYNDIIYPAVYVGAKALPYSPYREQLLTLPTPNGLPGIPVTSGGNYADSTGQQWVCDEVDLERGVRRQRVYKVDVDGENAKFVQAGDYANLVPRGIPIALYNQGQKIYATSTFTNLSWFYNTVNGQFLYLIAANLADQLNASCKKQLGKVYYALATPIETPLTPDEIAAYKALTAYGPDTVVQAGDGAGVKLVYQRDVNIAIKKLEDAVASMT